MDQLAELLSRPLKAIYSSNVAHAAGNPNDNNNNGAPNSTPAFGAGGKPPKPKQMPLRADASGLGSTSQHVPPTPSSKPSGEAYLQLRRQSYSANPDSIFTPDIPKSPDIIPREQKKAAKRASEEAKRLESERMVKDLKEKYNWTDEDLVLFFNPKSAAAQAQQNSYLSKEKAELMEQQLAEYSATRRKQAEKQRQLKLYQNLNQEDSQEIDATLIPGFAGDKKKKKKKDVQPVPTHNALPGTMTGQDQRAKEIEAAKQQALGLGDPNEPQHWEHYRGPKYKHLSNVYNQMISRWETLESYDDADAVINDAIVAEVGGMVGLSMNHLTLDPDRKLELSFVSNYNDNTTPGGFYVWGPPGGAGIEHHELTWELAGGLTTEMGQFALGVDQDGFSLKVDTLIGPIAYTGYQTVSLNGENNNQQHSIRFAPNDKLIFGYKSRHFGQGHQQSCFNCNTKFDTFNIGYELQHSHFNLLHTLKIAKRWFAFSPLSTLPHPAPQKTKKVIEHDLANAQKDLITSSLFSSCTINNLGDITLSGFSKMGFLRIVPSDWHTLTQLPQYLLDPLGLFTTQWNADPHEQYMHYVKTRKLSPMQRFLFNFKHNMNYMLFDATNIGQTITEWWNGHESEETIKQRQGQQMLDNTLNILDDLSNLGYQSNVQQAMKDTEAERQWEALVIENIKRKSQKWYWLIQNLAFTLRYALIQQRLDWRMSFNMILPKIKSLWRWWLATNPFYRPEKSNFFSNIIFHDKSNPDGSMLQKEPPRDEDGRMGNINQVDYEHDFQLFKINIDQEFSVLLTTLFQVWGGSDAQREAEMNQIRREFAKQRKIELQRQAKRNEFKAKMNDELKQEKKELAQTAGPTSQTITGPIEDPAVNQLIPPLRPVKIKFRGYKEWQKLQQKALELQEQMYSQYVDEDDPEYIEFFNLHYNDIWERLGACAVEFKLHFNPIFMQYGAVPRLGMRFFWQLPTSVYDYTYDDMDPWVPDEYDEDRGV